MNTTNTFSIDWIAYTLRYSDFPEGLHYAKMATSDVIRHYSWLDMVSEAAQVFDGEWVETSGLYSYKYGAEHSTGIKVFWSDDMKMGIHTVYSGTALRNVNALELIATLWALGAKFTRIDVCNDDFGEGITTVRDYVEMYQSGDYEGRKRSWHEIKSGNGGHTFYIGSRQSERMIRIYDKGSEQGLDADQWVRVELELKGDAAVGLAQHIGFYGANMQEIDFAGLMNAFVVFPNSTAWQRFPGAMFTLPKTEKGERGTKAWGLMAVRTICAQIDLDHEYLESVKTAFVRAGYSIDISKAD